MSRAQRILLVVLVVALLGVIALSVFNNDDDGGDSSGTRGPEVLSVAQLAAYAAESGEPVYWIGPRKGAAYELTVTSQGRTFVRYLRGGAQAGDERPDFVSVATYPAADGAAELSRAAREQEGAELERTAEGATLLLDPASPDSAYLAYPGANFQVEVFSPYPDHAERLVTDGEVLRIR